VRIVHILLGKANPESMNGVNKVVHHLATEQVRAGHAVEVWGLTNQAQRHPDREYNYELHLIPVTRVRFLASASLDSHLRSLQPGNWVQLHSVFIPEYWHIARRIRASGLRFGVTPHGGYSKHVIARGRLKKMLYLTTVDMAVLRRASLIHAIGATEVSDIRQLVPSANVALVPNGQHSIDVEENQGAAHAAVRPVFAFCGRLAMRHKGLDLLLQGFHEYLTAGGEGSLWLIGDGPDRVELESTVEERGLGPSVTFYGARFGTEKLGLLCAADVFVHTSRWDGIPTAVLEAAALGLPLLISRETNLGDSVSEHKAGVVLDDNTPPGIAKGLKQAAAWLAEGMAMELRQNARKMVAARFSWSAVSEALVDNYQAALTSEDGGHR